jgi:exonuclease VII small subunit
MDTATIIAELEAERDRLNRAIAALQRSQGGRGRTATGKLNGRKRHLSAAARKRIGAAMKKRWAERKKKQGAA